MNEKKENKKDIINENIENKEKTATFNLLEVTIIIVMTSIVVAISTGLIVYHNYGSIEHKNITANGDYLKEFESAYKNILNSYVETVDEKGLINSAIRGMYNYVGDPYTSYLDEETTEDLTDRLNGEYQGIGVEITASEGGILIVTVFKDGPAFSAGLQEGDLITSINGTDVTNKSASDASNMIKNSDKSKIEMIILRNDETKAIDVDIRKVYVPSVEKQNYDGVGYLRITTFSDTTFTQFEKQLKELEDEGIKSLIIDVRGNGGGYLNSAVDIAELFIEKGKNIYGLENKSGKTFYEDETKTARDYKVGVLINSGSASASEILAASLKESYGAILIGTKSYGKGTVQETSKLESGGMVKYTTAYWLTPSGTKIDGKGLKPDVEENGTFYDRIPYEEDTQLQTAINTVK